MDYVIVTVPHAACYDSYYRICDTRALQAANIVSKYLESFNLNVILLANYKVLRTEYDMNRPNSRNSNYRNQIENTINQIFARGDRVSFVLDMHSFPTEDSWSDYKKYDLVFLYLQKYREDQIFRPYFESDDRVGFLEGSNDNDIMYTSNARGIKSILVEVLEDFDILPNLDEYLHKIAKIISVHFK